MRAAGGGEAALSPGAARAAGGSSPVEARPLQAAGVRLPPGRQASAGAQALAALGRREHGRAPEVAKARPPRPAAVGPPELGRARHARAEPGRAEPPAAGRRDGSERAPAGRAVRTGAPLPGRDRWTGRVGRIARRGPARTGAGPTGRGRLGPVPTGSGRAGHVPIPPLRTAAWTLGGPTGPVRTGPVPLAAGRSGQG